KPDIILLLLFLFYRIILCMIRLCTKDDIDWLLNLAVECYPEFDVESSRKWLESIEGRKDIAIVRGEESAAMAYTTRPFWQKDLDCELQFICCRKNKFGAVELLHIVKYINDLRVQ